MALVAVVLACAAACGGEKTPASAPAAAVRAPSGSTVEPYFPLEEGRIYSYATNEAGETGMLVARVHRSDATHGELRLSNATKRFVYSAEGVAYDTGVFLLKAPLEVGTSWPGEHGGTTKITRTDAAPKVPAGSYTSCVETVEEGGRPPGARFTTTYCPGVGMVLLEVAFGGTESRAELRSYGMPAKIE